MVSKVNSLFSVLLFNILVFVLVTGNSPNGHGPTPAPTASSSISAPASAPTLPRCTFALDRPTVVSCSIVLIQGGGFGLPRNICCRGLKGLSEEDVYSCLCYVLKYSVKGKPLVELTVPAAVYIVSIACSF